MVYKKVLLLTITVISICKNLHGTEQYPDKIVYKNVTYEIYHNFPLKKYYQNHPEKFPQLKISTTALYRGFVGTFEIIEDGIYLKNIEVYVSNKNTGAKPPNTWKSILKNVFPGKSQIKIDWFSGVLVMKPERALSNSEQQESQMKTIILEVIKGQITFLKEFSYKNYLKFRKKQFKAYKKTKSYKNQMRSMKGEGLYNRRMEKRLIKENIFYYIESLKY